MNQVEQLRGDIAKMIDAGAPESDVDAYVAAHGLTANDFQKSTAESLGQSAKALGKGIALGTGKIVTGAAQAYGEATGGDKLMGPLTKKIATGLENRSQRNKAENPISGTIGEMVPNVGLMLPLGMAPQAVVGGSAILSALSPRNDGSVNPSQGTALERALTPVAEGASSLISAAGIDPESRIGMGASGALMGGGALGLGKGSSAILKYGNDGAKSAVRGLTKINQNAVKALNESGIPATLQLASDSPTLQAVSSSMQRLPLVGNRLESQAESAIRKLTSNVDDIAAPLGAASDAIEGGQALQQGVNKFQQQSSDMINRNYQTVDNLIPSDTPAITANTEKFSQGYLGKYSDAPSIGKAIQEPSVRSMAENILRDTNIKKSDNSLYVGSPAKKPSYGTIRNLRTDIGEAAGKIDAPSAYKGAYAAISKDLADTAASVSPEAAQAASRANNYFRAVAQRSDKLKTFFNQNKDGTFVMAPERAAQASRADLALLKKTIPQEDFNNYTSSVVRKLGEAPAGAQDATGNLFSPNTFLTNYSKLRQSGKTKVLFDSATERELNRAATVADRFRELSKSSNKSNTTNSAISVGSVAGLFLRPATTAALGVPAYGFERLLTSPKALKVINDYAYRPVTKNAKLRGEFSTKLFQAVGQDAETRQAAEQYIKELEQ